MAVIVRSVAAASLVLAASAAIIPVHQASSTAANVPLLVWHGLGDAFDSDGMKGVGDIYRNIYPDSAVYAVNIGGDGDGDRRASFFGNLNDQVDAVCEDMKKAKELAGATAINAVGFSQGGVFARGLVERCNAVPVRNLMTWGSPHGGINTFATCADDDWWCKTWSGTLKDNTWGGWVQTNLIPAQYFRDASDLDNYLEHSNYLADINNERKKKKAKYADKIAGLDRLVLIHFEDEDVVRPPGSTWFGDIDKKDGSPIPLGARDLYQQDWIGLKELDHTGGLIFRKTPGKHMQIADGELENAFREYFGFMGQVSGSSNSMTWDSLGQQSIVQFGGEELHDGELLDASAGRRPCTMGPSSAQAGDRLGGRQERLARLLAHYREEVAATFGWA